MNASASAYINNIKLTRLEHTDAPYYGGPLSANTTTADRAFSTSFTLTPLGANEYITAFYAQSLTSLAGTNFWRKNGGQLEPLTATDNIATTGNFLTNSVGNQFGSVWIGPWTFGPTQALAIIGDELLSGSLTAQAICAAKFYAGSSSGLSNIPPANSLSMITTSAGIVTAITNISISSITGSLSSSVNYWKRVGTVLIPVTVTDDVTTQGNISSTQNITATGTATFGAITNDFSVGHGQALYINGDTVSTGSLSSSTVSSGIIYASNKFLGGNADIQTISGNQFYASNLLNVYFVGVSDTPPDTTYVSSITALKGIVVGASHISINSITSGLTPYWSRTGSVLTPINVGDSLSASTLTAINNLSISGTNNSYLNTGSPIAKGIVLQGVAGFTQTSSVLSPPSVSGLILWLKPETLASSALGASISNWVDSSGSGYDMSQGTPGNQPTIASTLFNGYRVATFSSGNSTSLSNASVLGGSNFANKAGTFYIIYRMTTSTNISYGIARIGTAANGYDRFTDGNTYPDHFRNVRLNAYQALASSGTQIYGIVNNPTASGVWVGYVNGTSGSTQALSWGIAATFTIGRDNTGNFLPADVAEVMLYNRGLSDSERQGIEGYLASKYNIVSQLPATHSYSGATPAIYSNQTSNLTEWNSSVGTLMAYVDGSGNIQSISGNVGVWQRNQTTGLIQPQTTTDPILASSGLTASILNPSGIVSLVAQGAAGSTLGSPGAFLVKYSGSTTSLFVDGGGALYVGNTSQTTQMVINASLAGNSMIVAAQNTSTNGSTNTGISYRVKTFGGGSANFRLSTSGVDWTIGTNATNNSVSFADGTANTCLWLQYATQCVQIGAGGTPSHPDHLTVSSMNGFVQSQFGIYKYGLNTASAALFWVSSGGNVSVNCLTASTDAGAYRFSVSGDTSLSGNATIQNGITANSLSALSVSANKITTGGITATGSSLVTGLTGTKDFHTDANIDTSGRFSVNNVAGGNSNPVVVFTDQSLQAHTITIHAGIITSWLINGVEQLI